MHTRACIYNYLLAKGLGDLWRSGADVDGVVGPCLGVALAAVTLDDRDGAVLQEAARVGVLLQVGDREIRELLDVLDPDHLASRLLLLLLLLARTTAAAAAAAVAVLVLAFHALASAGSGRG